MFRNKSQPDAEMISSSTNDTKNKSVLTEIVNTELGHSKTMGKDNDLLTINNSIEEEKKSFGLFISRLLPIFRSQGPSSGHYRPKSFPGPRHMFVLSINEYCVFTF